MAASNALNSRLPVLFRRGLPSLSCVLTTLCHRKRADEFEMETVKEMEDLKVLYFTVNVTTKADRNRLEIPRNFTARCGFPSQMECTLVTSMSRVHQWPVQFRTEGVNNPRLSAFSVGDGFRKFVTDNKITYGTLLVLEHVDDRCLVVTFQHRQAETAKPPTPPPSPQTEVRPHFRKTLRANHTRLFKSTRLDIPTAFWRSEGEELFQGRWYTLQGPLQTVRVKSAMSNSQKQTFCHFTKGWIDFVAVNQLKLGDTLVFTKVGVAEFEVTRI